MEKEEEMGESESETPTIPEDVIMEHIIPRLAVKPQTRFKCVSKSWLSSITTPQLAKSRLKSSPSSSPQFLLFSRAPHSAPFTSLTFDEHGRVKETVNTGFAFSYEARFSFDVVGSSNGLVCFCNVTDSNFTICNPVTHKCSHIIPVISSNNNPDFNPEIVMTAGFYYLPSVDDYKIACLTSEPAVHSANNQFDLVVHVFSLRNRQWTTLVCVGTLTFAVAGLSRPALIGDTIYWYASNVQVIVGFNLVTKELSKIPCLIPSLIDDLHHIFGGVKLFATRERLSFLCAGQVWGLGEDGWSWTKLYDLNCNGFQLLCVCEITGKWLLVRNDDLLALVDPSQSLTPQFGQGCIPFGGHIYNAWNFMLSLIPPTLE